MKKIGSVIIFILLVSANAWSQTIPQILQGSWGANGSQAICINADGSGEWGAVNLVHSATFRVDGNTLHVQTLNFNGQMQWRIDGDSLFLTNPTGLGELLINHMKLLGVDRLTRMGDSITSGNSNNSVKSITITGISGMTGSVMITDNSEMVFGTGVISNNSVTLPLMTRSEEPFTGIGSYYFLIMFDDGSIYIYTNGKTLGELGITANSSEEDIVAKVPKYNISTTTSIIAFNQFKKSLWGNSRPGTRR